MSLIGKGGHKDPSALSPAMQQMLQQPIVSQPVNTRVPSALGGNPGLFGLLQNPGPTNPMVSRLNFGALPQSPIFGSFPWRRK